MDIGGNPAIGEPMTRKHPTSGFHFCPKCGTPTSEFVASQIVPGTSKGWICRSCKRTFTYSIMNHEMTKPVFCQLCGDDEGHEDDCPNKPICDGCDHPAHAPGRCPEEMPDDSTTRICQCGQRPVYEHAS